MHRVDKPILEKSKGEIARKIEGMGDYVKMSYLQRAMNSGLDFDTRKYVMVKLGEIYEDRGMYIEGAKMIKSAAEINTTFKDKIKDYMKCVQLNVKGNDFLEADRIFGQALALGNKHERKFMKEQRKDFFVEQGKYYVSNAKRNNARLTFEKCMTLDLSASEKSEIKRLLLELYESLGMVREFYSLKNK